MKLKNFVNLILILTFPITEITDVKGKNAHPIYKWATKNHGAQLIQNGIFIKF